MSPFSSACMSNCCWASVTSLPGFEPGLGHPREELELVAEAPVADLLALEVGRRGDVLVLEGDLQRARALEDLADVGDAGALLARLQRLGHPRDRVVGAALGELGLGHDVGAALEDLDVEPGVLVVALLQGGEVAGELRLGEPLQLQLDLGQLPWRRRPRSTCCPSSLSSLPQAAIASTHEASAAAQAARCRNLLTRVLLVVVARASPGARRAPRRGRRRARARSRPSRSPRPAGRPTPPRPR